MKKFFLKLLIFSLCLTLTAHSANADNKSQAESYIRKSEISTFQDESYEYIHKARILYQEDYEANPADIDTLLGLSKVYQLIGDRAEAKLYVLKAYNMSPGSPKLQRAMGDFYYSFQEYSTAIEYYKLALASGLLRDFDTNLQTAKCFEKLGDEENAELYYKISGYVNPSSKAVKVKLNEYESSHHPDDTAELDSMKYKYLFKDRPISEQEQTDNEADDIIRNINLIKPN